MEELWDLTRQEKPVFILFYATWCPHCRKMRPIIDRLKEQERGRLLFKEYDIDKEENQKVIEYYQVQAVPLMMVYRSGEQLWKRTGEIEENELEQTIERLL